MEYTSGVVVTTRQGMGRVLQATRAFSPGDLVLREAPLLFYFDELPNSHFDTFMETSAEEQQQILDLHRLKLGEPAHFTSCERRVGELEALARRVAAIWLRSSSSHGQAPDAAWPLAFELLSIAEFNGQRMANLPWQEAILKQQQARLPPGQPEMAGAAVFCLASRAVHACVLNCAVTTQNPYGGMSYYAAQPIAAGDLNTVAYADSSAAPTLERLERLARTKDFVCACARCAAPDATRGVACARCANGVVMP
ncbi:hypothetical protein JKP88DRAFT_166710, partial [Tribonema minus]